MVYGVIWINESWLLKSLYSLDWKQNMHIPPVIFISWLSSRQWLPPSLFSAWYRGLDNWLGLPRHLDKWFSECGLWTSSRVSISPAPAYWMSASEGGSSTLHFSKPSRWFWSLTEFENRWHGLLFSKKRKWKSWPPARSRMILEFAHWEGAI